MGELLTFLAKRARHLPDLNLGVRHRSQILAQKCFEKTPIIELPNYWLKGLVDDVKKFRLVHNIEPADQATAFSIFLNQFVLTQQRREGTNEPSEIKTLRWLKQLDMLIKLGWIETMQIAN